MNETIKCKNWQIVSGILEQEVSLPTKIVLRVLDLPDTSLDKKEVEVSFFLEKKKILNFKLVIFQIQKFERFAEVTLFHKLYFLTREEKSRIYSNLLPEEICKEVFAEYDLNCKISSMHNSKLPLCLVYQEPFFDLLSHLFFLSNVYLLCEKEGSVRVSSLHSLSVENSFLKKSPLTLLPNQTNFYSFEDSYFAYNKKSPLNVLSEGEKNVYVDTLEQLKQLPFKYNQIVRVLKYQYLLEYFSFELFESAVLEGQKLYVQKIKHNFSEEGIFLEVTLHSHLKTFYKEKSYGKQRGFINNPEKKELFQEEGNLFVQLLFAAKAVPITFFSLLMHSDAYIFSIPRHEEEVWIEFPNRFEGFVFGSCKNTMFKKSFDSQVMKLSATSPSDSQRISSFSLDLTKEKEFLEIQLPKDLKGIQGGNFSWTLKKGNMHIAIKGDLTIDCENFLINSKTLNMKVQEEMSVHNSTLELQTKTKISSKAQKIALEANGLDVNVQQSKIQTLQLDIKASAMKLFSPSMDIQSTNVQMKSAVLQLNSGILLVKSSLLRILGNMMFDGVILSLAQVINCVGIVTKMFGLLV